MKASRSNISILNSFITRRISSTTFKPAARPILPACTLTSSCPPHIQSSRFFSSSSPSFNSNNLSRTGLYDFHLENGAKMVPFAGYSMPLTYKNDGGQVASHLHVREKAGLFDVGHMVQHHFSGPGALAFLSHLLPSSLSSLEPFTSTLSVLLNHEGGILDDTVVTRQDGEKFYVVTNAGRRNEDLAWIGDRLKEWKGESVNHDILENWGLVALQGPQAAEVLSKHTDLDLSKLTFGKSAYAKVAGVECHIARGGYTGEDGFEISIPPSSTVDVTRALVETSPVQLAGLAARDSLRLEAGMCLYGHDLDESVSPIEAGLAWTVGKDRRTSADFIGHSRVLSELASKKPPRRRVGLIIEGAPAREGAKIFSSSNETEQIGRITSGIPSPSLGKNIAMGLVLNGNHKSGTKVLVEVRKKLREAEIVKMPFVENKFHRG